MRSAHKILVNENTLTKVDKIEIEKIISKNLFEKFQIRFIYLSPGTRLVWNLNDQNLSRRFVCATRGGIPQPIVGHYWKACYYILSLHALLFTHFRGTQEADFWNKTCLTTLDNLWKRIGQYSQFILRPPGLTLVPGVFLGCFIKEVRKTFNITYRQEFF